MTKRVSLAGLISFTEKGLKQRLVLWGICETDGWISDKKKCKSGRMNVEGIISLWRKQILFSTRYFSF